jgi:hypothetical protein
MPADDANGPGGRAARIGFFANADDTVRVAYDNARPAAAQRDWPEETDWPDEAAETDWPEWAEAEAGPGLRSGLIVALVLALVAAIAAAVGWSLTHPRRPAPEVAVATAPATVSSPPAATPPAPVAAEVQAPAPPAALPAEPPAVRHARAAAPPAKAKTTKTANAAAPAPPAPSKSGLNCANPQTVSRNLACDPELQAASQRVGRAYLAALAAGLPPDELRREQNDWLIDRDDAARQSPAALAAALRQRAEDLNRQRAQALAEPPH